jgi:hypothetical protein
MNNEKMSKLQSSLVEKRDMLIMEAISRTLGHTEWTYDEVRFMMKTRPFSDGSSVFSFKSKDMLLFEPEYLIDGELIQEVEYLYDKRDFIYMTHEERAERKDIILPTEDESDGTN